MPVPFLGRLAIPEYVALVGSFILVGLESLIRVLTLALPTSIINLFYRASRRLFNRLRSPARKRAEQRRKSISNSIRDAADFVDLCGLFGYTAEEHVVQTKDGFLLGVHRLAWRRGEEDMRVNNGPNSVKKRVVYLHHGLLMNSEVWVCLTDAQRALPFVLVDRGFDVWLGNNRGNKYSKKSVHCAPDSLKFWDFSIDEFAFHDIPDCIAYILEATGQQSLSYIGFSQGTAQAFASLAVHPMLNNQVNVFIALAPAMSPAGLHNGIVDALIKASPQVLFLLFGRRSILSSATMWESILYPPLFTYFIDTALGFLFNWRTQNISTSQKLAAYPHLYSFTSTKSVVHWFQIIRNKSFQMYDDDVHPPISLSSSSKYTKVAKYPTRNIRTPIVLVYGGSDSLVDINVMLRELPKQTIATGIPHYEHLDFLWARDVDEQVFPHVFDALESFTGPEHTKEEWNRYRTAREHTNLSAGISFSGPRQRRHSRSNSDVTDSDAAGSSKIAGNEADLSAVFRPREADHHGKVGGHQNMHRVPLSNMPAPKSPTPKHTPSTRRQRHGHGAKHSHQHTPTRTDMPFGDEHTASSHAADKGKGDLTTEPFDKSTIEKSSAVHPTSSEKRNGEEDEEPPRTPDSADTNRRRPKQRLSLDSVQGMKDGKGIAVGVSKAMEGSPT
ncbi:cholesterol esterase [Coniochaeta pulveracea]|uniref:Cholesterol esterase n=2 Tax=Coniochaeta pulveracea TaxID=177199 RepID=A0A420Y8T8_9PEZI|nr:cholesterol esterase [Coniochaeta pulveracea]